MEKVFDDCLVMISHFRMILEMPEHHSLMQIFEEQYKFGLLPTNILVRTVLHANVLENEFYYFGKKPILDFVEEGIG